METRNYTAKFNVGDSIVINNPDYEFFHGKPHPLAGKNGVVKKVIFPGEILYENWGLANGTGEVKYRVELDGIAYLLSGKELKKV